MAKFTPPYKSTGRFTVRDPFTIDDKSEYRCDSIRSLDEILALGLDPMQLYYAPLQLGDTEYQSDYAEGASIITLTSVTAPTLYIPDTYITSYPLLQGVPYRHAILSMSLGMVEESLDLSFLVEQLQNVGSDVIGITPEVKIHIGATTGIVDQPQHEALEQVRQAAIKVRDSDYVQKLELQRQNVLLHETINALQQFIRDKGLVP